jgi:hypothetical protein
VLLKRVVRRLGWERYKAAIWARGALTTWRNRVTRRRVTGDANVVVSLTTHGARLRTVHLVIESICAGTVRPARLVLWLNGDAATTVLPAGLVDLRGRGLEIRFVPNYGPHTKYYPYVALSDDAPVALATADDDMLYPRYWLERLVAAHAAEPGLVHCYRARRVKLDGERIAPYMAWDFDRSGTASYLNFATGVSGVIYPPAMVRALRAAGEAFRACCPKADDVWLHATALRCGLRIKQLGRHEMHFDALPDTQENSLFHSNLLGSGNDDQIAATYRAADIRMLLADATT